MPQRIRLLGHNIRSLWNVGSFFRTCDAFAVEKLYLTGYTGHPPRKEITKTAIGAEEFVPWEHHEDPIPIIEQLKKEGWQIVALEQTPDAIPLSSFPLPATNILLIVGHELTGVPLDLLAHCDTIVQIPMHGRKESLNVAVAVGIALFAMMREPCPSNSRRDSKSSHRNSRSMQRMPARSSASNAACASRATFTSRCTGTMDGCRE